MGNWGKKGSREGDEGKVCSGEAVIVLRWETGKEPEGKARELPI